MPRYSGASRALAYGPVVGEYHRAAMYGPGGSALTPRDIAVSPGSGYRLGQQVSASDASGNPCGTYNIGDWSYGRGGPTKGTVEFRERDLGGASVYLHPLSPRGLPNLGLGGPSSGIPPWLSAQGFPAPGSGGGAYAGYQPLLQSFQSLPSGSPIFGAGSNPLGWQTTTGVPALGSMSYIQAFGGGGPRRFLN